MNPIPHRQIPNKCAPLKKACPSELHLHIFLHYYVTPLLHSVMDKHPAAELAIRVDTSLLE